MPEKRNLTRELVTRNSRYSFMSYIGMLPNPDKILSRTGKSIDVYRDLKNDPHVWSCIQSRKSGVLSLEHILIPNGMSDAKVREISKIINGLDIYQVIRDILEAPLFGFQPIEITWETTAGGRKYFLPKKIQAKPQEWFFFDGEGNLRFRKKGEPKGVELPERKFICVRYEPGYLNPYGNALLSKCYWPVTFKNGGMRFWVNFMEKFGMPILTGQYTRGASFDESRKLAEELANMTEDAVIVTPSDIDIKLHEANRSSSVDLYKDLIKHCNAEVSKAILSQTLTTELEMGSYAASKTHFRIRQEVIQSDIKLVESAINTLIRYIVDLNFGGSEYPLFKVILSDSENMQAVDRDIKISRSGSIRFTKKYWMDNYGFKEDEIEAVGT